jgi:hypothetical protein
MNEPQTKFFHSLQVSDFERYPVWEFIIDHEADEVSAFPIAELPVADLTGRVVGTRVRLANGQLVWSTILHFDAKNSYRNEQLLKLRFERSGGWFDLARYWDLDYEKNGPDALAHFLGLSKPEIFLISYDLTAYVTGEHSVLVGNVLMEPRLRLPEDEIIRLAVPGRQTLEG